MDKSDTGAAFQSIGIKFARHRSGNVYGHVWSRYAATVPPGAISYCDSRQMAAVHETVTGTAERQNGRSR